MDRKKLFICIVFLTLIILIAGCASKQPGFETLDTDKSSLNDDVDASDEPSIEQAYDFLKDITYFSEGAVSWGGDIEHIEAFAKLLNSDDAKDYFIKLESEGTNEGKLFALCGFHFLDQDMYDEYIEKYKESKENVKILYGCLGEHIEISQLIETEFDEMLNELISNVENFNK